MERGPPAPAGAWGVVMSEPVLSMRCGRCDRKLAELLDLRQGAISIKCPRCGAITVQRAVESPPPRAPERPADGEAPCPTGPALVP
ncbi:Com family DNA-binding transcriptional regulator [Roseospira visakhapatnamensis]|uniref:Com family DNA-binding transcriptional regulator n=1 Tax=Roseospira visakhapatnamensis TaxID=390880 RepID=UPI003CCCCF68